MVYLQQGESPIVKGPTCFPVDPLLESLAYLVERGGILYSVFLAADEKVEEKLCVRSFGF